MFKSFRRASENMVKQLDDARVKMPPRERYNKDFQTRLSWMDFSVVKNDGRAFEADRELIPIDEAEPFAHINNAIDLTGHKSMLPHSNTTSAVKFVGFSSSQLGAKFVSTWLDPFHSTFNNNGKAATIEIHVIERVFLSMLKPVFLSGFKQQIPLDRHKNTLVVFGGLPDISADLMLPKKYTGYSYLLDGQNRIRWRGCGMAQQEEVDAMLRCASELLDTSIAVSRSSSSSGYGSGSVSASSRSR